MKTPNLTPVLPGIFGPPAPAFTVPGDGPHHDGATYEAEHDHVRLNAQTLAVWGVMKAGRWVTLRELSEATGAGEASVSARIRDLRKPKFGGHVVERGRVRDSGLFVYRLRPNPLSGSPDTAPDNVEHR